MKNNLKMLAVLAVLASCGKTAFPSEESAGATSSFDKVRATVEILGYGTKATQTESESKVNSLQIFVFDSDGELEDYRSVGAAMSAEICAVRGVKTIWAVVNATDMTDVVSIADLKARTTDLGKGNTASSLVMAGSTVTELTDGLKVEVIVERLVCKVILKKVSTAWTSEANRQKTFVINHIYMINVAGECNFGADAAPNVWYNKLGHHDTTLDAFLYRNPAVTLPDKSSYSTENSFYCYPNPVSTQSVADAWSPRRTMLVLDCTLGAEQVFYPVEMPVLVRNKVYTIEEMVITRKGSDKPYTPVIIGESTISVKVSDWEVGLNIDKIVI